MAMTRLASRVQVEGAASTYLVDGQRWRRGLLVDIGSTFTKVSVVEPGGQIVDTAMAPTTIEDDVVIGITAAVANLSRSGKFEWALACSSAAGGLRMVSVGLTEALSGRAAALAALGAGAKVVAAEAGYLDDRALQRIEDARPHLVLLSGGVDGGDEAGILHNARQLRKLSGAPGFIVAGNAFASNRAAAELCGVTSAVELVENVFPQPGTINLDDTRQAVRTLFMQHITRAKGLDRMMVELRTGCEPTPLAVSRGLPMMSGSHSETVVLVDLGGATTDVHSVGSGSTHSRGVDLPVPDVMRTVEGDLGMRWGAPGICDAMPDGDALREDAEMRRLHPSFLPSTTHDRVVERRLAEAAVGVALERHSGRVVVRHRPWGDRYSVTGKDLRDASLIIATGGVFIHLDEPTKTVRKAVMGVSDAFVPRNARILIDHDYVVYALGLVAAHSVAFATRMANTYLDQAEET